ncbi:MAG: hypothetical protein M1372_00960 [Patescibacteria group bacterium]|nr:hypothetical protein [Patescibacteria group bacterium]
MHYVLTGIYILLLILAISIGAYNLLFAVYANKAKNELVIALPNIVKRLLIANIFLALFTVIFLVSLTLRSFL